MNKSPKEMGTYPFVQAHRRSPEIFMNFLKFYEVKRNIIRGGREVYVVMLNILEEQVSMIEIWKNS